MIFLSERIADGLERIFRHLPAQVHTYLPGIGDLFCTFDAFYVVRRDAEVLRYDMDDQIGGDRLPFFR